MRIVLASATQLGLRCADALQADGQEICGILTIPQKFPISYAKEGMTNVLFADFPTFAAIQGIPSFTVTQGRATPELLEFLASCQGDMLLAIGWYYMIPSTVRNLFPRGAAGIHGSLLPKYRGGAPLVWATIHGETETGVSLFFLENGVDTGDILGQERFSIDETDTIRDLLAKLEQASVRLVRETIPRYSAGTLLPVTQNHEEATQFPQRQPIDGRIDWSWTNRDIYNWVRAQTCPYPGAFFDHQGRAISVWSVKPCDSRLPSGKLVVCGEYAAVGTADGSVLLTDISSGPYDHWQTLALLRQNNYSMLTS